MDITIPCEFCNQNIEFANYIQHCENCYIHNSLSVHIANQVPHTRSHNDIILSRISFPLDIDFIQRIFNMNLFELNEQLESTNGESINTPVSNIEACYNIIDDDQSRACTICFDDSSEKTFVKTLCNHIFCRDCISKWLTMRNKCPVCLYDFNR